MRILLKTIVVAAIVSLLALIAYGISEYIVSGDVPHKMDIYELRHGWKYCINDSEDWHSVSLPTVLELPKDAEKITLVNRLPDYVQTLGEPMLRFGVITQATVIYIDGIEVAGFGDRSADPVRYSFVNAEYMFMLGLDHEDHGKEIRIELNSIVPSELGMLRSVEIGSHSDFIIRNIFGESYSFLIFGFLAAACLIVLLLYISFKLQGIRIFPAHTVALLTFLAVIYISTDTFLIMEAANYTPSYSLLSDWLFYIAEAFIPIVGYMLLLGVFQFKLGTGTMIYIYVHIALFIVWSVLLAFWILPIDVLEPCSMAASLVGYLLIFIQTRKQWDKSISSHYVMAVFALVVGVLADYIKFAVVFLPFELPHIGNLSVELPYLFFFGISCIVYVAQIFLGIVDVVSEERYALRSAVYAANMGLASAEDHYNTMLEGIDNLRHMKHDAAYHFRVMGGLINNNQFEELRTYFFELVESSKRYSDTNYCMHYAANVLIGHYADSFAERHIRFVCKANIPQDVFVDRLQLCTLLGNALQNALEACVKISDQDKRYVSLQINCTNDNIGMVVKNSFDGCIKQDRGRIISSKDESHGLGLSSINRIVSMYDGYFNTSADNGCFTLELLLVARK